MITAEQEQRIEHLSDTELYPLAVEFMRGVAKKLPTTQINGLVNVALGKNTYQQLKEFVEYQQNRSTWRASERHVPDFYRRFSNKFKDLEKYALTVIALQPAKTSPEGRDEIRIAIVREFIQHLLAENDYMGATQAFADNNGNPARAHQERSQHYNQHDAQGRGRTSK